MALGVAPGWRCLDAGAGNGSFGAGRQQMDLVADALPRDSFDFVHTRLLLMHRPWRDVVLRRLAAALRPGGVLMVEEDDIHPITATAAGAYREAWTVFLAMTRGAGVDPEWARHLPQQLDALGLVGVGAEIDSQLFRGGSLRAELWSLSCVGELVPADTYDRSAPQPYTARPRCRRSATKQPLRSTCTT